MTLNVNGATGAVDVLPQETLAHTLRYKLGLTGTKLGCDHGECGDCTVMIDDVTVYSCSTLTHSVRGRKIITSRASRDRTASCTRCRRRMSRRLGPQCGFCTAARWWPRWRCSSTIRKPTVEEARLAMSGNLCRCGAYDHYLKGVMRAAQGG